MKDKEIYAEKEKEEIRTKISEIIPLITKLIEDKNILYKDKYLLKDIKMDLKKMSDRIKQKTFYLYPDYKIESLNSLQNMKNLYLPSNK